MFKVGYEAKNGQYYVPTEMDSFILKFFTDIYVV